MLILKIISVKGNPGKRMSRYNGSTMHYVCNLKKTEFYFQFFSINYLRQIPRKFRIYYPNFIFLVRLWVIFELREYSCLTYKVHFQRIFYQTNFLMILLAEPTIESPSIWKPFWVKKAPAHYLRLVFQLMLSTQPWIGWCSWGVNPIGLERH